MNRFLSKPAQQGGGSNAGAKPNSLCFEIISCKSESTTVPAVESLRLCFQGREHDGVPPFLLLEDGFIPEKVVKISDRATWSASPRPAKASGNGGACSSKRRSCSESEPEKLHSKPLDADVGRKRRKVETPRKWTCEASTARMACWNLFYGTYGTPAGETRQIPEGQFEPEGMQWDSDCENDVVKKQAADREQHDRIKRPPQVKRVRRICRRDVHYRLETVFAGLVELAGLDGLVAPPDHEAPELTYFSDVKQPAARQGTVQPRRAWSLAARDEAARRHEEKPLLAAKGALHGQWESQRKAQTLGGVSNGVQRHEFSPKVGGGTSGSPGLLAGCKPQGSGCQPHRSAAVSPTTTAERESGGSLVSGKLQEAALRGPSGAVEGRDKELQIQGEVPTQPPCSSQDHDRENSESKPLVQRLDKGANGLELQEIQRGSSVCFRRKPTMIWSQRGAEARKGRARARARARLALQNSCRRRRGRLRTLRQVARLCPGASLRRRKDSQIPLMAAVPSGGLPETSVEETCGLEASMKPAPGKKDRGAGVACAAEEWLLAETRKERLWPEALDLSLGLHPLTGWLFLDASEEQVGPEEEAEDEEGVGVVGDAFCKEGLGRVQLSCAATKDESLRSQKEEISDALATSCLTTSVTADGVESKGAVKAEVGTVGRKRWELPEVAAAALSESAAVSVAEAVGVLVSSGLITQCTKGRSTLLGGVLLSSLVPGSGGTTQDDSRPQPASEVSVLDPGSRAVEELGRARETRQDGNDVERLRQRGEEGRDSREDCRGHETVVAHGRRQPGRWKKRVVRRHCRWLTISSLTAADSPREVCRSTKFKETRRACKAKEERPRGLRAKEQKKPRTSDREPRGRLPDKQEECTERKCTESVESKVASKVDEPQELGDDNAVTLDLSTDMQVEAKEKEEDGKGRRRKGERGREAAPDGENPQEADMETEPKRARVGDSSTDMGTNEKHGRAEKRQREEAKIGGVSMHLEAIDDPGPASDQSAPAVFDGRGEGASKGRNSAGERRGGKSGKGRLKVRRQREKEKVAEVSIEHGRGAPEGELESPRQGQLSRGGKGPSEVGEPKAMSSIVGKCKVGVEAERAHARREGARAGKKRSAARRKARVDLVGNEGKAGNKKGVASMEHEGASCKSGGKFINISKLDMKTGTGDDQKGSSTHELARRGMESVHRNKAKAEVQAAVGADTDEQAAAGAEWAVEPAAGLKESGRKRTKAVPKRMRRIPTATIEDQAGVPRRPVLNAVALQNEGPEGARGRKEDNGIAGAAGGMPLPQGMPNCRRAAEMAETQKRRASQEWAEAGTEMEFVSADAKLPESKRPRRQRGAPFWLVKESFVDPIFTSSGCALASTSREGRFLSNEHAASVRGRAGDSRKQKGGAGPVEAAFASQGQGGPALHSSAIGWTPTDVEDQKGSGTCLRLSNQKTGAASVSHTAEGAQGPKATPVPSSHPEETSSKRPALEAGKARPMDQSHRWGRKEPRASGASAIGRACRPVSARGKVVSRAQGGGIAISAKSLDEAKTLEGETLNGKASPSAQRRVET